MLPPVQFHCALSKIKDVATGRSNICKIVTISQMVIFKWSFRGRCRCREFKQPQSLRQIKRQLKINIGEMMTSFAIIPFCSHSILLKNFCTGALVERCHLADCVREFHEGAWYSCTPMIFPQPNRSYFFGVLYAGRRLWLSSLSFWLIDLEPS